MFCKCPAASPTSAPIGVSGSGSLSNSIAQHTAQTHAHTHVTPSLKLPHWLRRRLRHGASLEAYAGSGELTNALRNLGCRTQKPLEAFHRKGAYDRACDLHHTDVQHRIRDSILSGEVVCVHFGLPCKTWGSLARINGSTRTTSRPSGPGSSPSIAVNRREREANAEASFVV